MGVQTGFVLFSFAWDDGSYYTLLGCVHDKLEQSVYLSFLFNALHVEIGGEE